MNNLLPSTESSLLTTLRAHLITGMSLIATGLAVYQSQFFRAPSLKPRLRNGQQCSRVLVSSMDKCSEKVNYMSPRRTQSVKIVEERLLIGRVDTLELAQTF